MRGVLPLLKGGQPQLHVAVGARKVGLPGHLALFTAVWVVPGCLGGKEFRRDQVDQAVIVPDSKR